MAVEELVAGKGDHDNGLLAGFTRFPLRYPDLHPGTQAGQAGVGEQAGGTAGSLPGESATGSGRTRAEIEPVEKRAGGTNLCPRLRDGRRTEKLAPGADQREESAPLAVLCLCNLGLVMRTCYGMGKPRSGASAAIAILVLTRVHLDGVAA